MTKPANSPNKPSPSDTPTSRPDDEGHKSVVENADKKYNADEPEQENIAEYYENREQPTATVKDAPKEDQPDTSKDDTRRRLESK